MKTLKNLGLNNWSKDLLERTISVREAGVRTLPSGEKVEFDRQVDVPAASREARECALVGGHPVCMQRYRLADGSEIDEYVQHIVTNCNVNCFLALRRVDNSQPITESLWLDHEISTWSACYCRHTC